MTEDDLWVVGGIRRDVDKDIAEMLMNVKGMVTKRD
jgi:hypothetical protein